MLKTIIIKNQATVEVTYSGQVIEPGESYIVKPGEISRFGESESLMKDVASGMTLIGNGEYFFNSTEGWLWLNGNLSKVDVLQASDSQGNKVAVHTSSKPMLEGKSFYATWIGAGDNPDNGAIAGGEILILDLGEGVTEGDRDVFFHPDNGEVYLFDGHINWYGDSTEAYITVEVIGKASQLQTFVNLDLVIDGSWVKFSSEGPGTGTHGFAENPTLIPRSFTKDGDWDYSNATGLVPNLSGNGSFKISTEDTVVHTFINKMPLLGSSNGFFKLHSEESTLLPPGFYVKLRVHKNSSGVIKTSALMYVYRQKTTHTP